VREKTRRFICKKTEIQLAHQIDGYLAISRGNSISPEMEMQSSTKLLLFLLQFISFANKPLGKENKKERVCEEEVNVSRDVKGDRFANNNELKSILKDHYSFCLFVCVF